MRPVLILNSTTRLDHKEEGNYFAWVGSAKTAQVGDDVIIECPADAYPLPVIQWFKDDKPLNTSALLPIKDKRKPSNRLKYILTPKALTIRSVNSEDEATYKCLATNSFQLQYHESPREFQLTLEHYLRIPSKMSWIIPLLVIITSLLLLVLIIWACSRHDHNKSNQYNVAQKEKEHFRSKKAPTDAEDELDD
ncbi:Ig-like domain-containing protein [Meloidogyne graminicola]|uniref:Ig-like domain-containing protein n=1 Tax=Meloidogyne graminicola TaxID=189291 RepID=A0A8S9ZIU3_9BILA|nr:Ig-like domain-containing protein [Meloidogyne graminicola]